MQKVINALGEAFIVCIGREESSGTRDGFESITDTEDACVSARN